MDFDFLISYWYVSILEAELIESIFYKFVNYVIYVMRLLFNFQKTDGVFQQAYSN